MHTTGERASFALTTADLTTRFDPQPRIQDLRLAQSLGFARPRIIRELITRNSEELKRYGSLAVQHGKSRGQTYTEYWLTEGQALCLSALSNAPRAPEARHALISVYMAYRRELTPTISDRPAPAEDGPVWQGLPVYTYATLARTLGVRGGSLRFAASYHRRHLREGRDYFRLFGPDVQHLARHYPGCGLSPRATQTTLWTPAGAQFLAAHVRQGLHDAAPPLPYSGLAAATLTADGLTAQEQALILFVRHLASAGGLLPR